MNSKEIMRFIRKQPESDPIKGHVGGWVWYMTCRRRACAPYLAIRFNDVR